MQNLQKIVFYCSLLTILLSADSCRKKKQQPITYTFTLEEAKAYLWADSGSYWIYRNTKDGALDTQTCLAYSLRQEGSHGYNYNGKATVILYDKLSRTIKSTYNDWLELQSTDSYSADNNHTSAYPISFSRVATNKTYCFVFPFKPLTFVEELTHSTFYNGMDSTMVMQGKTYHNVAKFIVDKDPIGDEKLGCQGSNNIYYWAKDVGLIKKELKTCGFSWELIDYKINR